MILPVHERLRERLLAALQQLYQLPPDALPQLPVEYPPSRELGDLSTPVAFELARRLRKAPKMIAQEIADVLSGVDGVSRVTAVNGYLNVALDRPRFATAWLAAPGDAPPRTGKATVEPTANNPKQAAHTRHAPQPTPARARGRAL